MCAILSNALNLRDDLGGRNTASYFCHLPSIATLNLILSSSLLSRFLFFFYGKLNLPEQCGPVFHSAARSFACRGEKPPAGTSRRPFLITEGQRRHPINCQEALKKKKKELEIDSSPTALALRDGVTWQSSIEMHGWRVMKRRWRGGEEEEARVEIQYIRT